MQGVGGLLTAFAAGVVSFLSPCVLPLVPGYLSFLTGIKPVELTEDRPALGAVLVPSLMFVAGFTIVFVALGASASALGSLLTQYRDALGKVAGLFVFAMGLLLTGVIKVPWLYGEARFDMGRARSFGRWAGLVLGMAFAVGWTPCVGPVLASILAMAGSSAEVGRGAALLLAYSAGFAVPFLATALLFGRLAPALRWLNRHTLLMNRVAGALLMLLGALIFFDRLAAVAALLNDWLPAFEVG